MQIIVHPEMVQKNICVQCGTGVEEQKAVKKSGKTFCSEAHAQQYEKRSEDKCGGGC